MPKYLYNAKKALRALGDARASEAQLRRELDHGTVTPSRADELAAAVRLARVAVDRAAAAWDAIAVTLTAADIRRVAASL